MYPRIKVTLLTVCGAHFGPPLIEWLSRELKVPKVCIGVGLGGVGGIWHLMDGWAD